MSDDGRLCPVDYIDICAWGREEPIRTETVPGWECPACGAHERPREEPKGVYCPACRTKISGCCEGAPL